MQGQPIDGIRPVPPVPSILTAAKPLTRGSQPDGVSGEGAALPGGAIEGPWWAQGVSWRSAACAPGYRWPMCPDRTGGLGGAGVFEAGGAGDPVKEEAPELLDHNFRPYMIYVPWSCDWVVEGTEDRYGYRADVFAQIEAVSAYNVAHELWTRAADSTEADQSSANQSLTTAATLLNTSDAVNPLWAVGRLLEAYGDCAQSGGAVLHIPAVLVPGLLQQNMLSQVGDTLRGPLGSVVSPGPGYPTEGNWGPDSNTAGEGESWMYVTGPVEYALGTPRLLPEEPHYDRRTNRYTIEAQRLAIHRFDPCCVFGVLTAIPNAPTLAS